VRAAIHVKQDITWSICSDVLNYQTTVPNVIPIYRELIKAGRKVLVYSGNTDACVPYTGTQNWISSLNLPITGTEWQEWTFNQPDGSQVGGYVTEYTGLTFATVRGAGHMVPQNRPQAAYVMASTFIKQGSLQSLAAQS